MWSVVSSGDLPDGERFEWFADMISREVMPTRLTSERPAEFTADAALLDLGELQVSEVAYAPLRSQRTPALIRRGDPEQYQLGLVTKGAMTLVQHGNSCEAEVGDLVFWDTSRPSDARYVSDGDPGQLVILQLPRDVLPLPAKRLDSLLARRMPGGSGVGAVLVAFLRSLVAHGGECAPDELRRIGSTAVDLAAACLAQHTDAEEQLPAEVRARALIRRIHAFIEYNLGDPELSPVAVAAHHNMSVRALHQLFRGEGETVQARVRRRRLERCRADLLRPELLTYPVQAIAARWGFSGPAVFSRSFREAYGVSPTELRARAFTGEDSRLR
ncbi:MULTISPECIES: AraC family transcriptional regulator [Streptomyces]|uniref:Transcriptional regulator, AraC family n=1 Tax=Streptomyces venezuelae (strain ATCC 10712 / CBS 650.69 / DSM 40230 / JCM 4526 / NBRC 13096 / PD 04745) TaxID=953739 RepID=F2R6E4_STRVP|nr:AraC family transcriptional regulator [Streptomyces venezuelae]APE22074.1 AraC family transcriptional regulator [Streptomyces venezuelae]QER99463.1 AraC family transcriptional regulator [Streptomyces venezuelae ATCC 10712]CCA56195.1 Transcriptional regulator, AraC family [Streptomyces venezuelae ATCC 10712]